MGQHKNFIILKILVVLSLSSKLTAGIEFDCVTGNKKSCIVKPVPGDFSNQVITLKSDQSPDKITKVNISGTALGRVPSEIFNQFPKLKKVVLNDVKIESLDGIPSETKIDELEVSSNHVTEIKKGQLPATVRVLTISKNKVTTIEKDALSHVAFVELDHNKIKVLPKNVFPVSIALISINDNEIENIDEMFRGLPAVEIIFASKNKIVRVSENAFADCVSLELLDLSYNAIETLPSNVFDNLWNLQDLILTGNRLTSLNMKISSKWFGKLNVNENALTELALVKAVDELKANVTIQAKDNFLSHVELDTKIRLENIDLTNNSITSFKMFENQAFMGAVDLSHNNLSGMSLDALASLKVAQQLNLTDTGLDIDQVRHVLNFPLYDQDLSYNPSVDNVVWGEIPSNDKIQNIWLKGHNLKKIKVTDLKHAVPHLTKVWLLDSMMDCEAIKTLKNELAVENVIWRNFEETNC